MFDTVEIAPSVLSANLIDLGSDLKAIEEGKAAYVHVDVMDGHFVPNLSMGVPLIKQLRKATDLLLDVHLMIDNPLVQIPWYISAGADIITVHLEAFENASQVNRALKMINDAGLKAGLAIKPKTEYSDVLEYLDDLYMVLVMSVE
ncbi:MAG: ribulose-phosphate 3-epimerase, partial [Eggerthellaceae bacterium]|nr:ribulose-phosphate 3-epimerase [Eggerthellaceae bacterium]